MGRKHRATRRYDQQSRRRYSQRSLLRQGYLVEICLTIPGEPPCECGPGAAFFPADRAEPTTPARAMGSSTSSECDSPSGHQQRT